MTAKRFAIAAVAGALTMFVWGAFSHMVLIKGIGFTPLPHEERVLAELTSAIKDDGLYFFPGIDLAHATPEANAAWEAKFRAGPSGLLVYHPSGGEPVSGRKLLVEFLTGLFAAAIVTYLLACAVASGRQRAAIGALLGAFACLSVSGLYWNWYGFPTAFFLAQCVDKVAGWALSGVVMARLVPAPRRDGAGHLYS